MSFWESFGPRDFCRIGIFLPASKILTIRALLLNFGEKILIVCSMIICSSNVPTMCSCEDRHPHQLGRISKLNYQAILSLARFTHVFLLVMGPISLIYNFCFCFFLCSPVSLFCWHIKYDKQQPKKLTVSGHRLSFD